MENCILSNRKQTDYKIKRLNNKIDKITEELKNYDERSKTEFYKITNEMKDYDARSQTEFDKIHNALQVLTDKLDQKPKA